MHRLIAVAVLIFWLWVLDHLQRWLPGLYAVMHNHASWRPVGRSSGGEIDVLMLPFLGIALLAFPDVFADRFSPFTRMTNQPVLTAGFWRACGYFTLLVSLGLVQFFR